MPITQKRDQIWQLASVQKVCLEAEAWLATQHGAIDYKHLQQQRADDFRTLLGKFAKLRAIAKAWEGPLDEYFQILSAARAILARVNVDEQVSRLKFLHSDLWSATADVYLRNKELFMAQWYAAMSGVTLPPEPSNVALDWPQQIHRHFIFLKESPDVAGEFWQRRMTGLGLYAVSQLRFAAREDSRDSELHWEHAIANTQLTRDFEPIAQRIRSLSQATLERLLLSWLWTLSLPSKSNTKAIRALVTPLLRRLPESDALQQVFQLCDTIERAYDKTVALMPRLEDLARCASKTPSIPSLEFQMIADLATIRTLIRLKQKHLISPCLVRYQALSLLCSNGLTNDVFELINDASADLQVPRRIPESAISRFGKIGGTVFEVSRLLGPKRLISLMRGKYEGILSIEEQAQVMHLVGEALTELRGPLAKVGQLIGYYLGVVSVPISDALSQLYSSNHPVPYSEIFAILQAEYGERLYELFLRIEPDPVGVGTVAQVHRAITRDGRTVALKVKMPGIEKVFSSDLKILSSLLPLFKMLAPRFDFDALFEIISKGLFCEVDFAVERRLHTRMEDTFKDNEHIGIPCLYSDLCTESVIASEHIDGQSLDEFAQTASQDHRDRAGESIVRFVTQTMMEGYYNSDPNPGNFLFCGKKVYFLDFGSSQRLSDHQAVASATLIRSVLDQDPTLFRVALKMMKFVEGRRNFDFERAFESFRGENMGMWAVDRVHEIEMGPLIQSFLNMVPLKPQKEKSVRNMGQSSVAYTFPPEYFFFFRVYFGHLLLLSKLKAKCNWHQIVRDVMERYGKKIELV